LQGRRAKSYGAAGDTRRRMEDEDDRAQNIKEVLLCIKQNTRMKIKKSKQQN